MPDDKELLKQDFQQRHARKQRRLSESHYTDSQGFVDSHAQDQGRQRANSARRHADDQREASRAAHVMAEYRRQPPTPSVPGRIGRNAWLAGPGTPGVPGTLNGEYHAAENDARQELNDPNGDPRRAGELLDLAIDKRQEAAKGKAPDKGHQTAIQLLRDRRGSIDRAINSSAGTLPQLPDPEAAFNDAAADHVIAFKEASARALAEAEQKAKEKQQGRISATPIETEPSVAAPKARKSRRRKNRRKDPPPPVPEPRQKSGQRHSYEALPDSPRRERSGSDDSGPTQQSVCSRIRKSFCNVM